MPVPVDPFLVEALGNPRHRVTVLRMEMDIQRFMKNPTSTNLNSRTLRHHILGVVPIVWLSITGYRPFPAQQPEKEIAEKIKIAIRPRPRSASSQNAAELYNKSGLRTVEERKEEYDKARARIFSGSNSPVEEGSSSPVLAEGRGLFTNRDEQECTKVTDDIEKFTKEGGSRVAIFKDREKDRSDPDYDRSYDRYVRGLMHNQSFSLGACTMVQPPLPQFDARISQFGHLPRNQTP
uniref:SUZ domain-containing protein n=1 Tax=Ananas comosus var. bracteatus TaxID=296719 RepID=A0A6V7PFC2_ANACO|nr:unnamed protein product [Ananas comosus var. bracteatus]